MHEISINITTAAKAHVNKYVKKYLEKKPSAVFRLAVEDSGCSGMKYVTDIVEQPKAEDICKTDGDFTYYVDKNSVRILNRATLDCIEEKMGMTRLAFTHNPNVAHSCGCGESFSTKDKGE